MKKIASTSIKESSHGCLFCSSLLHTEQPGSTNDCSRENRQEYVLIMLMYFIAANTDHRKSSLNGHYFSVQNKKT